MKLNIWRGRAMAAGLALAALGATGAAQARDVVWSVGVGAPGAQVIVGNAPVYVAPAPRYYRPPPAYYAPPVYYSPPPVYYSPPPVYYQPRPVYHAPPHFHGRGHDRGYRDHRGPRGRDWRR
jgi:hypothetical protein